ncbi:Sec-independent protein translocase protein TatB [Roseovarius dicentrarchi]|uniref:Sec-independent protein translocase protein TatB n=1 Tax=Roseovarius dicentrarchi TaxID=2250573 RepID=UPI000DE8EE29|nr:Sec-independent protein translocase protein TatB [Roseovarius dicentrarchi]
MFDLGWTELLLIGIVALIVVGPKDLPGMFRTVGQFVGKAKGMAREFSKAMNDAADESGVSGMSDSLRKATNPIGSAMDEVRKSTKSFTEATRDAGKPKDAKLSPERQEAKDKITAHSAKATQARLDREKADAAATADASADAPATDAATPRPATEKAPADKAPAKKAAPGTGPKAKPAAKASEAAKADSAAKAPKAAAKKPAAKKPSEGTA